MHRPGGPVPRLDRATAWLTTLSTLREAIGFATKVTVILIAVGPANPGDSPGGVPATARQVSLGPDPRRGAGAGAPGPALP